MTNDSAKALQEAVAEIIAATDALKNATDAVVSARREETSALNRLNEAQKKFDTVVKGVRENPFLRSDWYVKLRDVSGKLGFE